MLKTFSRIMVKITKYCKNSNKIRDILKLPGYLVEKNELRCRNK